jgi:TolB-like protein
MQATGDQASIAVLPFENRTGDAGKEYFSDGMAEELIDRLSKVEGLKVASRTSSFAYKGKGADIRQVARDLGVKTVLEGSVRISGKTIRITAQLADAETGYNLWSETYERRDGDIFKIQDDLASQIVTAFRKTMGAKLPEYVSQKPPTENLEAYSLFLQARSIAAGNTRADFDRAQQLLSEALRIDPGFASAKEAISSIQLLGVVIGVYEPEVLSSSEKLAREALQLNPDLGEAYGTLGSIAALRGKWIEAADDFKRANERGPGAGRSSFATFLAGAAGKSREVEAAAAETFRQAPGDPMAATVMGATNFMLGNNADARRYVEMAINLGRPANIAPAPRILSDLKLRAGDLEGAAQIAVDALPPEWRSKGAEQTVRIVYAGLADPRRSAQAKEALKSFIAQAGPSALMQGDRELTIMTWFTLLGDLDAAYTRANELVDAGRRAGFVGRLWVWVWAPELVSFRRDPRFQPLMEKIGLMDYWRKFGPPDSCELANNKLSCH